MQIWRDGLHNNIFLSNLVWVIGVDSWEFRTVTSGLLKIEHDY